MDVELLRSRIRPALERSFGARLRAIILFGSRARGDAAADSDIDLLVLLDDPLRAGADTNTIIDALYPFQLEIGVPIHALPARAVSYEAGTYALYRNAREEGVAL